LPLKAPKKYRILCVIFTNGYKTVEKRLTTEGNRYKVKVERGKDRRDINDFGRNEKD
jgi:hypothetical protein